MSASIAGKASSAALGQRAKPGEVLACLHAAAQQHRVSFALLHAIAQVESGGNSLAINRSNRNGTRDLGLMQINSAWLPTLSRWYIREEDLFQPCVSAYVGAWILADNIARIGPVWKAVGAYNARTPRRQWEYVRKVQAELARQTRLAAQATHHQGAVTERQPGLRARAASRRHAATPNSRAAAP